MRHRGKAYGLLARWQVLRAAVRDGRLTKADVAVLGAVLERVSATTGLARPGLPRIATDAGGISKRSVARCLARIEACGYLTRDRSKGGRGEHSTTRYRMVNSDQPVTANSDRPVTPSSDQPVHSTVTARSPEHASKSEPASRASASSGETLAPLAGAAHPLWDIGLRWLVGAGSTEKQGRSILGRIRKSVGDHVAGELVTEGQRLAVSNPVAWLLAAAAKRASKPRGKAQRALFNPPEADAEAANADVLARMGVTA